MEIYFYIMTGVFGLFIGSFLNVCIYRIPKKQSIVWPGSKCPKCDTPIKAYDNIPVLSWLILRGKCRKCGESISPRYPIVESITAIFAVLFFDKFGMTPEFFVYYAFTCSMIVMTFIDIDHHIIPNRISLGGLVVGWVFVLLKWLPINYLDALIGMALGGGLLYLIRFSYELIMKQEGMGLGDVKLLAMIGVFIGWRGVLFDIFAASLIGAVIGVAWSYINRKGLKAEIPFGPFLAIGALMYLLWGPPLITWYLGFMRSPG